MKKRIFTRLSYILFLLSNIQNIIYSSENNSKALVTKTTSVAVVPHQTKGPQLHLHTNEVDDFNISTPKEKTDFSGEPIVDDNLLSKLAVTTSTAVAVTATSNTPKKYNVKFIDFYVEQIISHYPHGMRIQLPDCYRFADVINEDRNKGLISNEDIRQMVNYTLELKSNISDKQKKDALLKLCGSLCTKTTTIQDTDTYVSQPTIATVIMIHLLQRDIISLEDFFSLLEGSILNYTGNHLENVANILSYGLKRDYFNFNDIRPMLKKLLDSNNNTSENCIHLLLYNMYAVYNSINTEELLAILVDQNTTIETKNDMQASDLFIQKYQSFSTFLNIALRFFNMFPIRKEKKDYYNIGAFSALLSHSQRDIQTLTKQALQEHEKRGHYPTEKQIVDAINKQQRLSCMAS